MLALATGLLSSPRTTPAKVEVRDCDMAGMVKAAKIAAATTTIDTRDRVRTRTVLLRCMVRLRWELLLNSLVVRRRECVLGACVCVVPEPAWRYRCTLVRRRRDERETRLW